MTHHPILTEEHILAIRNAHRIIMDQVNRMVAACATPEERLELGPFGPLGFYRRRLGELCPGALQAWDRYLEERKEAAQRIDPDTCSWQVVFTNSLDPYAILDCEEGGIDLDFVVWDNASNGMIQSCSLSPEQYNALRERIECEAKALVPSSFALTSGGLQRMPMPSSIRGWDTSRILRQSHNRLRMLLGRGCLSDCDRM